MATTADHLRTTLDGRWREVRERVRGELNDERFAPHYTPNTAIARSKALEQMRVLADLGYAANGFAVSHGGTGDAGGAVTSIEMLAMSDLSLMVKAGVQWGLFGGAIENLGTERHHQAYVKPLIDLDLLGCFAMTETGHGSDVQELETTATYDVETGEFVVNSPTPSSRKDYIGGAAQHATVAAVFAQLITGGESQGVHCFVVPIRDDAGNDLPGVTTSDCGSRVDCPESTTAASSSTRSASRVRIYSTVTPTSPRTARTARRSRTRTVVSSRWSAHWFVDVSPSVVPRQRPPASDWPSPVDTPCSAGSSVLRRVTTKS